ncbi:tetratricopeptide repeat protein [Flavobacterium sp. ZT3R17]|uniref:tetratricopeptide repeat protein n=1 Tax=Flavobacterium cryoconiti TaxID=3398736 RepID=UPI003A85C114
MKKLILITLLLSSFVGWSQDPIAYDFFDQALKKAASGNIKGSIDDYTKAIKRDPLFAEAYLNRALSKQKIGDIKGALVDVNTTISIDPKRGDAYTTRADINYKSKNYKGTIEDCTQSIVLNPKDYIAYNLRGLSYIHIEDKKNACADFSKAIQYGSQSATKNKKMFCK